MFYGSSYRSSPAPQKIPNLVTIVHFSTYLDVELLDGRVGTQSALIVKHTVFHADEPSWDYLMADYSECLHLCLYICPANYNYSANCKIIICWLMIQFGEISKVQKQGQQSVYPSLNTDQVDRVSQRAQYSRTLKNCYKPPQTHHLLHSHLSWAWTDSLCVSGVSL